MGDVKDLRIMLLGKTGDGRSSTGNTILGGDFKVESSPESTTKAGSMQSKKHNGKLISVIDTPGFYNTLLTEEQLNDDIVRCLTECSPGPHAFVIVLRAAAEMGGVLRKVTESIPEEAFKFTVVLFTFGAEIMDDYRTFEDFVKESKQETKELRELLEKCEDRCHVIDNKYWNQEHEYQSNQVQVEKLLNTIEEMVKENGGGCYTNEVLELIDERVENEIQEIAVETKQTDKKVLKQEAREKVKRVLQLTLRVTIVGICGAVCGLGCSFIEEVASSADLGTLSVVRLVRGAVEGAIIGVESGLGEKKFRAAILKAFEENKEKIKKIK